MDPIYEFDFPSNQVSSTEPLSSGFIYVKGDAPSSGRSHFSVMTRLEEGEYRLDLRLLARRVQIW